MANQVLKHIKYEKTYFFFSVVGIHLWYIIFPECAKRNNLMVWTGNYTLMISDCPPTFLIFDDWNDNTDNTDGSIFPARPSVTRRHLGRKVSHLSVFMELQLLFHRMTTFLPHRSQTKPVLFDRETLYWLHWLLLYLCEFVWTDTWDKLVWRIEIFITCCS